MAETDRLELCGLEVACIIGDRLDEREREQTVRVDLALWLDLADAAANDDLARTVDYAHLAEAVRAALRQTRCRMIERAADCVARICLSDPRVRAVRVRVEKPSAIPGLRAAAVVLERSRAEPVA